MSGAELGADGRYRGQLPCRWCDARLDQAGRRKPRLYCRTSHRLKVYGTWLAGLVASAF
ncbi:hypothetical protein [Streptomyces sp. A0642]|uniref:hypothetical protein n=1 Tax=unclassified Streptomyces TaxID=2593676 RepID=UPI001445CB82|nr:hypothetical protein [Streptomyces sp. A0642]